MPKIFLMPRYEYKIVKIDKLENTRNSEGYWTYGLDKDSAEAILSKNAVDGWRLKCCYPVPYNSSHGLHSVHFIFERRVIERKSYDDEED